MGTAKKLSIPQSRFLCVQVVASTDRRTILRILFQSLRPGRKLCICKNSVPISRQTKGRPLPTRRQTNQYAVFPRFARGSYSSPRYCIDSIWVISSFLLLCLNTMRNATLSIVFYRFLPLTQSKIPQKLFSPPGRKHNCIACPPHPDVPKMQFSGRNIIAAIQAVRCIKRSPVYMCINHFWIDTSCGGGVLDGHFLTSLT